MKKTLVVCSVLLYLLAAGGCVQPEHHRGDVLTSPEEGDIDEINWTNNSGEQHPATLLCAQRLKIISLDSDDKKNFDNSRGFLKYNRCLITMNPGFHTLIVRFNWVGNTSGDLPVSFTLQPGIRYKMRVTSVVGKNDFRPEIVPIADAQPAVQADRP